MLTHGIQACRSFICVCSPTYGDLDISPWSHNELVQADRRARLEGAPAILPIWYSGAYPPADTACVLEPGAGAARKDTLLARVPAGSKPAEEMPMETVMRQLQVALSAVGVLPSGQDAAPGGAAA